MKDVNFPQAPIFSLAHKSRPSSPSPTIRRITQSTKTRRRPPTPQQTNKKPAPTRAGVGSAASAAAAPAAGDSGRPWQPALRPGPRPREGGCFPWPAAGLGGEACGRGWDAAPLPLQLPGMLWESRGPGAAPPPRPAGPRRPPPAFVPRPRSLRTRGRGLRGPAPQPQALRKTATPRRTRARGPLSGSAATCPGRPRALGAAGGRGAGRRPPDSPLAWPGRPGPPAPAIAERETVRASGRASCFPGADCSRLPSGSTSSHPTSFPSPPGGRSGARSFRSAVTRPGKPSWRRKTGQDRGGARQAPRNLDTREPSSPRTPEGGRFQSAAPAGTALQLSAGPRVPGRGDRSWGTAAPFLQRVGLEATGCGASR
ncbi:collagen alpha-1(I) chain-like [Onychomys torridus]|uniref:collagen alpha-1(I) chain-like n=1 Tax=Onychomys torridus TaxID=38674 RepID=UPI00167F7035|nr:collagen alpha-1(I) chain-like [Onychomys torridus]